MRGLMAAKKSTAGGGEIIENPILSNFKEGLSILEYFISTHGARKGLGYGLKKRMGYQQEGYMILIIVNIEDCGTLRGVEVSALKKNEVVESLGERILGRVALQDVVNPLTNEVLVPAGQQITEVNMKAIDASPSRKLKFVL
jgi:DNA-directed RNA polymerase subunit beta'